MTTLETFTDEVQSELKKIIAPLDLQQGELASLGGALTSIRHLIAKLREFVENYSFVDANEETRFFKEIKPVFVSQYYYHKRVFSLRVRSSMLSIDDTQRCIDQALRKCHSYTVRHQEFYRYCLSGEKHHDAQYFMRSRQLAIDVNSDPRFTTSHDSVLSGLIAGQLLADFLAQWSTSLHAEPKGFTHQLKWTGSKTDLTELIYALQAAEVFNNGSADIKQIATALESITGINLGDYYRTFQAIQVRKNNQLVFMTRLKDRLQSRLDNTL